MDYETATDFELNKALFPASRDYLKCEDVMEKKNPARSGFMWGDGCNWFEFNPCNNWNDIMPIAVELKVKLDPRRVSPKLGWMASFDDQNYAVDQSPQRSLVICCIKALESKGK